MKHLFRTRYRIVRDGYAGYEVQYRYWWMPIYFQCAFCNTHQTLEAAKKFLAGQQQQIVYES